MWTLKSQIANSDEKYLRRADEALARVHAADEIGFSKVATLERALELTSKAVQPLLQTCEQVIVLGIGGSALGAQALAQALRPEMLASQKILFFDNIDSHSFYRKLQWIKNPQKSVFLLISKSGSTIETLTQAEFLNSYLLKNFNITLQSRALVITEPRSNPLYDWMTDSSRKMEVPLNVGGRYSVLTSVGLGPAALMGISIEKIIAGAKSALQKNNLVREMTARFLKSFDDNEQITYFFNYCDDLDYFGMWIEQLWAESLGKSLNTKGGKAPAASAPFSLRGATDQHSVLQQIAEGVQKKFVCFMRVGQSEVSNELMGATPLFKGLDLMAGQSLGQLMAAEAEGTERALNDLKVNSLSLSTLKLTEEAMGYIMMSFEMTVAALGLALDIDPFNQPGVEHGKIITRTILKQKK